MDLTKLSVIDWAALIGAAAWTPQIITWVYRFFTKPKISIYVYPVLEMGYTSYGPIFNVRFALLSEKKDIILNKFYVKIKHENGASHVFDWDGLSEDLSEIQNPLGPTMSIKKTVLPLVVKVLHTGVAQLFVRFQHEQFKKNSKKVFAPALDKFQFLKNSGKLKTEQNIDDLVSEQEFVAITKLFNSEFIWTAGKYTVEFIFHSPSKFNYKKDQYMFKLSQDDVEDLKQNIENIKLNLTQTAKTSIFPDYKLKDINWIWKNPELQKNNM